MARRQQQGDRALRPAMCSPGRPMPAGVAGQCRCGVADGRGWGQRRAVVSGAAVRHPTQREQAPPTTRVRRVTLIAPDSPPAPTMSVRA